MERWLRLKDRVHAAWIRASVTYKAWRAQVNAGTDWWEPIVPGPCWVCGEESTVALLDLGYQHLDCDWFPTPDGDVRIVRGERIVEVDDE